MFNKSIKIYSKVLKESGFTDGLKYLPNEVQLENNEGRKRKRKITWLNPPYSKNIKTNVGRVFMKLLNKHCPVSHILHKIFNKNTIKISYGCVKNINSVMPSHNKHSKSQNIVWVYLTKKESCPMYGECLTSQLVYRATVTNAIKENMKKEKHSNHKKDFQHQKYRSCTELAKHVWELKEKKHHANNQMRNIKYTLWQS